MSLAVYGRTENKSFMRGIYLLVLIVLVSLQACGSGNDERYRYYTTTNLEPTSLELSVADSLLSGLTMPGKLEALQWELPQEWKTVEASGVRFANFRSVATSVETTIVSFPGDVGTLQANVERWLRQMEAQVSPTLLNQYLTQLMPASNDQGMRYVKIDLMEFAAQPGSTAIIAVILRIGGQSVFIKMQGTQRLLTRERANFDVLLASLQLSV